MSRATRRPPFPPRHVLAAGKAVLVAATAFLAILSASSASTGTGGTGDITGTTGGLMSQAEKPAAPELSALTTQQHRLEQLAARHDCSATGFGPDVIPGSSLVLRGNRVRLVSFDDGWDVYVGSRSGTLLAVCRPTL